VLRDLVAAGDRTTRDNGTIVWTSVDYELDWPAELVRAELFALLNSPYRGWTGDEVELLLTEAFHTEIPAAEFRRLHSAAEWDNDPAPTKAWIADLVEHLHELRPHAPPRPYWTARRAGPAAFSAPSPTTAPDRFAALIEDLRANGYLARDFAKPCVDEDPDQHYGRDLNSELQQRLHQPSHRKLWPLQPETWDTDTDTFYSLIEVFHDLVARPRRRWDHDHGDCGPHFDDFETEAGRQVYRALVNRILDKHAVGLRLAEHGEDTGRLVRVVDEARTELIEQAMGTPDPPVAARVEHAVALFRGREATEHDKRSAAITLAGILEERRALIRTQLGRKDEGTLFSLANEFAIRHQRRGQQSDYDPAFLDWMVWWYLATIALTDQIIARQDVGETA
jgi:hypothetical protein